MSNGRILVVEDDFDISNMLRIFFTGQGYKVKVASRARDAYTLCLKWMPSVVILDIMLPDYDGYELCRQWRGLPRTAHIPIIFLTQKDERSDRIHGLELGADHYIIKPFDIEELKLTVRNTIQIPQRYNILHPITGLPSDRILYEHWQDLLDIQNWTYFEIAINQIETFKNTYGSMARDEILQEVAQALNESVIEYGRPSDFLGHTVDNLFCLITLADDESKMVASIRQKLSECIYSFLEGKLTEQGEESPNWEMPVPGLDISIGTVFGKTKPFSNIREIEQEARESRLLDSYLAKSPFWGSQQEVSQWLGQIIDWAAIGIQLTIPAELARQAGQQQKILECLVKTLLEIRTTYGEEVDRLFYLSHGRFILVTQTAEPILMKEMIYDNFRQALSLDKLLNNKVPELTISWTLPHQDRVLDVHHLFNLLFHATIDDELLFTGLTDKDEITIQQQTNWPRFRNLLTKHFSISELGDLCFDLGIDYETLQGSSKVETCRVLIEYCQRHVMAAKLVARCQELRPTIVW